jgi:hypothetical protein
MTWTWLKKKLKISKMSCTHDWICGTFIVVNDVTKIQTTCTICGEDFLADLRKDSPYMMKNEDVQKELRNMRRNK